MGLIAFAIAIWLYAAFGRDPRRHPALWSFLGAPLTIGIIFTVLGSGFAGYGRWQVQIERHVLAHGVIARAFVRGPEQTLARRNGRFLWRIRYQYPDQAGRAQEASTPLMTEDEALLWHAADVAHVRYDPERPSHSVWLGIREDPAK
jgi:hypothetical protein